MFIFYCTVSVVVGGKRDTADILIKYKLCFFFTPLKNLFFLRILFTRFLDSEPR